MVNSELYAERNVSIREAMRKLDALENKVLLLCDEAGHLTGTLTDGDVRRFLLGGGTLDDAADAASNRAPIVARTLGQAKTLYDKNQYRVIPIVNEEREIIGVFVGEADRLHSYAKLNIPVVINAGGRGSRLEPYTRILPKPLIPVGELPIIEHIVRQFEPYGCDRFHVIVNYKKQLIKAYFSENERQYQLCWYDEEKPLGTGGGLSLLRGNIQSTFFLTNCDILLLSDYEDMLRYHKAQGNAITMVAARKNVVIPYGVVETGEDGTIEEFREKPAFDFLTNTGMYIVEPEVLNDIEEDVPIGFPTIMEQQKAKGKKIGAYTVAEDQWLDMGQLEELEQMRKRLYGE